VSVGRKAVGDICIVPCIMSPKVSRGITGYIVLPLKEISSLVM
jgi:hypothetical protein